METRIITDLRINMLPRHEVHFKPLTREEAQSMLQDLQLKSDTGEISYHKAKIEQDLGMKVGIVSSGTLPVILKPGFRWLLARIDPIRDDIDWWLITVGDELDPGL
jgi:hypothetical protein